ncbi:hypothetical protein MD484_g7002, partial [Candolleomyces efflorescens]
MGDDSVGVEDGGGVGASGGDEEGVDVGEEEGEPVDEEDRVGKSGGKEGTETEMGGVVGLKVQIQRENTLKKTNTYPEDAEGDDSDIGGFVDAPDVNNIEDVVVAAADDVIDR